MSLKPIAALLLLMSGITTFAQDLSVADLGSTVSRETAEQWINNYKKQFNFSSEHFCGKNRIREMFRGAHAAGVYVIKGVDEQGNERLLVKLADENGLMLKDSKIILTEMGLAQGSINNTGLLMNDAEMQPMTKKFQDKQQDEEFAAHVYGKKVFENLLSQTGADGIYIAKGMDEKGVEHLVLAAVDGKGAVMWADTIWNHGSGIFSIFFPIFVASK